MTTRPIAILETSERSTRMLIRLGDDDVMVRRVLGLGSHRAVSQLRPRLGDPYREPVTPEY